jgi:hypothetical protein
MSATARTAQIAGEAADTHPALVAGMWVLAVYNVVLALFMAIAPHAFYRAVGPFGAYNAHYVRDNATFSAAFAVGFALALRRESWRVPLLALSLVQFALHSANHLIDIGSAHPAWTGYFDFFSLLLATLAIARLLSLAAGEARERATRTEGAHP